MSERSPSNDALTEVALPDWLDNAAVVVGTSPPLPSWLEPDQPIDSDMPSWSLGRGAIDTGTVRTETPARIMERRPVFRAVGSERRRVDDHEDGRSLQRPRRGAFWPSPKGRDRRGLATVAAGLALAAALGGAVLAAPPLIEALPNADTTRAFGAVDRLRVGAPVLVVLDYVPDRASDFAELEDLVLRHAAARGARLIMVSPEPALAAGLRDRVPDVAFTALPAFRNEADSIQRLGQRESVTGIPSDPVLRSAAGDRPLELIVVIGDQVATTRWLSNVKRGAKPPAIAVIAGDTTLVNPLRASGQLSGIVRARRDWDGYAALAGAGAPPSRAGTTAWGPSLIASAVIVLASIARLARLCRR